MDGRSNRRVVVLFPGALGDLMLAIPALAAVRTRHGAACMTLAVPGWLGAFATITGVAHEVASLDDADAAGLFGGTRLPMWFGAQPVLYSWIGARDPEVAARLRALAGEAHLFAIARGDGPEHAADVYLDQVGARRANFTWPPIAVTPRVEALMAGARGPVLAVHPGAGSLVKRWTIEGFHDLTRRWRDAGGDVVEIVGPAERALPPLPDARRAVDWSLVDVAALLATVDAYVGNDSGITHLAGAAGARGIAIFGPTDARRWAPRVDGIGTLTATTWSSSGIPLTGVAPAEVWRALAQRGCLDKLQRRT